MKKWTLLCFSVVVVPVLMAPTCGPASNYTAAQLPDNGVGASCNDLLVQGRNTRVCEPPLECDCTAAAVEALYSRATPKAKGLYLEILTCVQKNAGFGDWCTKDGVLWNWDWTEHLRAITARGAVCDVAYSACASDS